MSDELARRIILKLRSAGATVAVAESLTGGLVVSRLIDIPRASEVVAGGVVTYATELKARLLGVDRALLAESGPVHERSPRRWRRACASCSPSTGGRRHRPRDDGRRRPGAAGRPRTRRGLHRDRGRRDSTTVHHLHLTGDRNEVRAEVVEQLLRHLDARLASPEGLTPE